MKELNRKLNRSSDLEMSSGDDKGSSRNAWHQEFSEETNDETVCMVRNASGVGKETGLSKDRFSAFTNYPNSI